MEAHPPRIDYLAELTVTQPPRTKQSADLLLDLLARISSTVQHLDLHLPPMGVSDLGKGDLIIDGYRSFLLRLAEAVTTWDKVIELRVSVLGQDGLELLRPIIAACPRIQALVLYPLNIDVSTSKVVHQAKEAVPFPPLPNLRTLAVVPLLPPSPSNYFAIPPHMEHLGYKPLHHRCCEILDKVVPSAPGIETLMIDGPHLLQGATLKTFIENLPRLDKLFLDITREVDWGSITQLDTDLSVLWLKRESLYGPRADASKLTGPKSKSVRRLPPILRCQGHNPDLCQTPHLPILPRLRVLTFSGPGDSKSCWESWRGLDPARFGVGPSPVMDDVTLADQFRYQPQLEAVLLKPTSSETRILGDFKDGYMDREYSQVNRGLRAQYGILARRYTSPYTPADHAFWHILSTRPRSTGSSRYLAVYRGMLVPSDIIRDAYAASVQPLDWLTSKLDCRFGQAGLDGTVDLAKEAAAWDVLDQWYNEQGADRMKG